ncbi:MAG TPA: ATP-binding protein [Blastocatellia bacterium]|nr:ATP-binding protein [Blastocatellia bacterium]
MEAGPIRVLLIEDDEDDYIIARDLLCGNGSVKCELEWVRTHGEGLEAIGRNRHDVYLVDYRLGERDGLTLLREAIKRGCEAPIIIMTGRGDRDVDIDAMRAGAADYLVKGRIDAQVLDRSIRYAIEGKRARDELRRKNEELRTMSQELWQAAKLATVGELTASIAHELNNPLAIVSLRIDSLLDKTPFDDVRRAPLKVIQQEVQRMGTLVGNLLQFSRRGHPHTSTFDLREEIGATLDLIHYRLAARRIDVECQFASDVPLIQADRQQLRQLFLNLLSNAGDAMPAGGSLTIRLARAAMERAGDAVSIDFTDTGVGIAPHDLPKVMEPFFTTKREGEGTGLGLAICRRIVQEHGGRIDIVSKPGAGTAVRVVLPVANGTNDVHLREAGSGRPAPGSWEDFSMPEKS